MDQNPNIPISPNASIQQAINHIISSWNKTEKFSNNGESNNRLLVFFLNSLEFTRQTGHIQDTHITKYFYSTTHKPRY